MNDKDPQYQVDQAFAGLFQAIEVLDALRMNNDTADIVLRDWRMAEQASNVLDDLAFDIWDATHKRAAE